MTATASVRAAKDSPDGDVKASTVNMKQSEPTYGKCVFELDFRSAIEKGLIADFKVVVVGMKGAEWKAHQVWGEEDLKQFPDLSFDTLVGTKKKEKNKKALLVSENENGKMMERTVSLPQWKRVK